MGRMQNVFRKCKQPWNMFEMRRSNALIRIRGKHVAHISKSKEQLHKNTHFLPLFKTETDKRGIELGNPGESLKCFINLIGINFLTIFDPSERLVHNPPYSLRLVKSMKQKQIEQISLEFTALLFCFLSKRTARNEEGSNKTGMSSTKTRVTTISQRP